MLYKNEQPYLDLIQRILNNGVERKDRTGVGTISCFGESVTLSLEDNCVPLITTKKTFFKGIVEELLFFIKGQTNTKLLEAKGVNIWKGNSSREFLDSRGLTSYPEGEIGPMYGSQWRNFGSTGTCDQLSNALHLIKTNPDSRRIVVTAYNPQASDLCVLDPCHMFFQFFVEGDTLSCVFYMRSCDVFLGLPFNLASYGILTKIFAKACGLKPKTLTFFAGDTHIYSNHVNQAREQLSRKPFDFPKLEINKSISSIKDMEDLTFEDFILQDYLFHPPIKAPMAI